jgi:hypothetical protein
MKNYWINLFKQKKLVKKMKELINQSIAKKIFSPINNWKNIKGKRP